MIIRIDENETETVVYRLRFICWVVGLMSFYISNIFELTAIPFLYRKLMKRDKANLLEWFTRFQWFWCTTELYPAGTKIHIGKSRLTIGYLRYLRGF